MRDLVGAGRKRQSDPGVRMGDGGRLVRHPAHGAQRRARDPPAGEPEQHHERGGSDGKGEQQTMAALRFWHERRTDHDHDRGAVDVAGFGQQPGAAAERRDAAVELERARLEHEALLARGEQVLVGADRRRQVLHRAELREDLGVDLGRRQLVAAGAEALDDAVDALPKPLRDQLIRVARLEGHQQQAHREDEQCRSEREQGREPTPKRQSRTSHVRACTAGAPAEFGVIAAFVGRST